MEDSNGRSPKAAYLHKLRQAQFQEQRKLQRDKKLTPEQKRRAKRQIIIKYKHLRRSTDFMQ